MTPILKVITEYCSIYVDDIRLQELAVTDSPLFCRRMWGYFQPAISLFTLPAEMQTYLVGTTDQPKLTVPTYGNTLYTTTEEYTESFSIPLGADYAGYELFCCRQRITDLLGNVTYAPVNAVYNSETGEVTILVSEGGSVEAGTVYDFDFYTDGYFAEDLSLEVMDILGTCFALVWQERFSNDWLSNVSKVEDKSFYEQNRANKIRADGERTSQIRATLAGKMRRFEQNHYYLQTVPAGQRIKI